MSKECTHGYKYRVRENYGYDNSYFIEKKSLCNGKTHDITAGSLFYKEISTTHLLTFEDIIKCAYLFLENNNFCLDIQSNWNPIYDGDLQEKYISNNPIITRKATLSKMISENDISTLKNEAEDKWKQDLINNLFKGDK